MNRCIATFVNTNLLVLSPIWHMGTRSHYHEIGRILKLAKYWLRIYRSNLTLFRQWLIISAIFQWFRSLKMHKQTLNGSFSVGDGALTEGFGHLPKFWTHSSILGVLFIVWSWDLIYTHQNFCFLLQNNNNDDTTNEIININ